MAGRALVLSGIAAMGLGLVAAGAMFAEPGGDDPRGRHAERASPAALEWELWQPEAGAPPAGQPGTAFAAEVMPESGDRLRQPLPDDFTAPTNVWGTAAEWSDED